MKAAIRGTEIYFDITGMHVAPYKNGYIEKPVLFLLHGGPGGNHLHFKQHTLALQDVAQLVFIDNRGSGWSKKTKSADYTLDNNIEDIEALRQYLGIKHICLLGISYGGMVAQGYAIRYAKHVNKLILAATAPSYRFIEEAKLNLQKIGNQKQIDICNQYLWKGRFNNYRSVLEYFKIMDPLYSAKKIRNPVKLPVLDPPFVSYRVLNAGFGGDLHQFDFIPHLKKITRPTLILAGQEDWICSTKQAKILARHLPTSKLVIFKNCGHSIPKDAHQKYISVIKNFLIKKEKNDQ